MPEADDFDGTEAGADVTARSPSDNPGDSPIEEEPNTTGTLFVMIVFLMALAGLWGIMYLQLLDR